MKYKDIKDFYQRCEEHPDHQSGMVTHRMIQERLSDEIDELRNYIEQRTWVKLTDEQFLKACKIAEGGNYMVAFQRIQQWLKENNT
jgi:hypothetical protein